MKREFIGCPCGNSRGGIQAVFQLMRVLALDTTTPGGSVAIVDHEGELYERAGDASRSHAERLPGALLDLAQAAGLTLRDIDGFAIVSGPGGFTGLRVGIAAIQGLAFATGKRIVAIPTLLALAGSVAARVAPGDRIGVWMDARRGEIFSALWAVTAAPAGSPLHLEEIEPPALARPAEVRMRWAAKPPSLIVGDGAMVYASMANALAPAISPPPLAAVVARMTVHYAAAGLSVDPAGVQPVYVRRPDAEVAREERARAGLVGRP